MPPAPGLSSNTLRQVVHVSLGGKRLRIRFSNQYGSEPVTMNSVNIALSRGGGTVDSSTHRALMFNGSASTSLAPGQTIMSDPLDFPLSPLSDLALTIHFGNTSSNVTGHPGSRATSYLIRGNSANSSTMSPAVTTPHWYILTAIDVLSDSSAAAIIVLGDSITDGRGSATDGNNRWPDCLARRLVTGSATPAISVINQGIGGNAVLSGGLGPPALARFDRDVLQQPGARWLIILEGVNDIGNSQAEEAIATNLIAAYEQMIEKAHTRKLRVYGVPILPFAGSRYFSAAHEAARQQVNRWIRSSGKFDGVIDLEAAVCDPANPQALLPAYDSGDHLHLNPLGYQTMAEAVDLTLFSN